jgi:hypothetical protein
MPLEYGMPRRTLIAEFARIDWAIGDGSGMIGGRKSLPIQILRDRSRFVHSRGGCE